MGSPIGVQGEGRMVRSMARSPESVNDELGGMGWSLRMIVKSLRHDFCQRGAGDAGKTGLRRTRLTERQTANARVDLGESALH